MLKKASRFSTRRFDLTFRRGRRIRIGKFLFIVQKSTDNAHFSVVVGKKTSKKAVTRNRIRRQIYEIIRTTPKAQNTSHNIIFLYNGPDTFQDAKALKSALQKLKNTLF